MLIPIAEAHGRSVAQVMLRWQIQSDVVVIPKSVAPERIRQNIDVFDFELTAGEMEIIAGLDQGGALFFDRRDPAMVVRLASPRLGSPRLGASRLIRLQRIIDGSCNGAMVALE